MDKTILFFEKKKVQTICHLWWNWAPDGFGFIVPSVDDAWRFALTEVGEVIDAELRKKKYLRNNEREPSVEKELADVLFMVTTAGEVDPLTSWDTLTHGQTQSYYLSLFEDGGRHFQYYDVLAYVVAVNASPINYFRDHLNMVLADQVIEFIVEVFYDLFQKNASEVMTEKLATMAAKYGKEGEFRELVKNAK